MEVGGDEGLDNRRILPIGFVENPELEMLAGSIPGKDRTDLVAGEKLHFSRRVPRGDTHPVVIRVGCDHKIGTGGVRLSDRHRKSLGIFRVGGFDRWEPSIRDFLRGDSLAKEAEPFEHGFDNDATDAVKRGVNDF